MTPAPRRLTMQLTPLLDLLLIVIFAQYMEVSETDAARAASVARNEAALTASQAETERLQTALSDAFRLIAEAQRHAILAGAIRRNREELVERDQAFAESQDRQQILGRLLVELFQIPQSVVDELLDPQRVPPLSESEEELERLRAEFRRLTEANPGYLIKHLLTFDEVRKRCDFWEVHLQANSRTLSLLDAQREPHELTLPLEDAGRGASLDRPEFERELYTLLKSWPEPKSLVEVIFTSDERARINVRDPIREGIVRVLDRLRAESVERTRFEFADLGTALP